MTVHQNRNIFRYDILKSIIIHGGHESYLNHYKRILESDHRRGIF